VTIPLLSQKGYVTFSQIPQAPPHLSRQRDTARTWDILRAWTGIDIRESGSKIESPDNVIYMTIDEHLSFGEFEFYLDKDAVQSTSFSC